MPSHIEPTRHQLEALSDAARSGDASVVMINLLALRADGGEASYRRYAREVQPQLERVGARILYAGWAAETVIGGQDQLWWDAIVVVQYPSRSAFLAMIRDPGYQAISAHRSEALVTSELVATNPWLPEP